MIESVVEWLTKHALLLGSLASATAVVAFVWTIIPKPSRKSKPTDLSDETIDKIKLPLVKEGPALSVAEFIRLRRELKADLEAELDEASTAEKEQLVARIAELES